MLSGPPQTTLWILELPNLERNRIAPQDMSHNVKCLAPVMYVGVYGHLFCSAM